MVPDEVEKDTTRGGGLSGTGGWEGAIGFPFWVHAVWVSGGKGAVIDVGRWGWGVGG